MLIPPNWPINIRKELAHAETARAAGKEGMARVCARRAAGLAIGIYLTRLGLPLPGPSAYDRLLYLSGLSGTTSRQAEICQQLTLRVNTDFELPIEADLLAAARELIASLLEETP